MFELRSMKVLPIFSVLLAALAAWFYVFGSATEGGDIEPPTSYASDFWSLWERWERDDGELFYKFSNPGSELFHIENKSTISSFKWYRSGEMEIKPYRGGYLVGISSVLDMWVDQPEKMSEKWTVSSEKYHALKNLRNGGFKLTSGNNKIIVWIKNLTEPSNIKGFTPSLLEDRIVYTRIEVEEVVEVFVPVTRVVVHDVLGVTRNHLSGNDMDVVWNADSHAVQAMGADSQVIWSVKLDNDLKPIGWRSFEVDLYGNNKYQTSFAVSDAVYVIDVRGNNVLGFPYKKNGITSFAVYDYDHNDKFRFLVGTADGHLYNLRGEGNRTPGWDFTVLRNGVSIQQLDHIRVGQRDYLYAGCSDGTVRLLKRNGQLRGSTPVMIYPMFAPAIRLSSTIENTSVLFVDEEGWLQECTFSDGQYVGMSGLVQADQVSLIDMDGDGVEEVVTELLGVTSVFNSRNERIN